jgi:two-component system chemotaxis sensor kinase CheA
MDGNARDDLAARLRATFLSELEDLLREAEGHFTRLSTNPGDPDAIAALFRVMHTLKGASRAAGFTELESVCHDLESLLAAARGGTSPLGAAELASLSHGLDALSSAAEQNRVSSASSAPPIGSSDDEGSERS